MLSNKNVEMMSGYACEHHKKNCHWDGKKCLDHKIEHMSGCNTKCEDISDTESCNNNHHCQWKDNKCHRK